MTLVAHCKCVKLLRLGRRPYATSRKAYCIPWVITPDSRTVRVSSYWSALETRAPPKLRISGTPVSLMTVYWLPIERIHMQTMQRPKDLLLNTISRRQRPWQMVNPLPWLTFADWLTWWNSSAISPHSGSSTAKSVQWQLCTSFEGKCHYCCGQWIQCFLQAASI